MGGCCVGGSEELVLAPLIMVGGKFNFVVDIKACHM